MSNFKQNGINFTIDNNYQPGEKKHAIKGKIVSVANDYAGYEQDDASKLINAVEIDWNGAVLPNSNTSFGTSITINTTGEIIRGTLRGN